MYTKHLNSLVGRVNEQIKKNREIMDLYDNDKIKRESRKSYMVANGKVPPDGW